jgi:hypothetical protein
VNHGSEASTFERGGLLRALRTFQNEHVIDLGAGSEHAGHGRDHQPLVGLALEGVAAEEPVLSQFPEIVRLADRRAIDSKPGEIVGWIGRDRRHLAVHQQVNLTGREARQFDLEVDLHQL